MKYLGAAFFNHSMETIRRRNARQNFMTASLFFAVA